ncbi:phosphoenolpyruvate--protein phosphotransferase [Faecalispora jeddahensis]|uniref:phosphoenolpyruvate--protein phosphotransferase n=1 Tax=Faecalispora jeddahensis TaxID=1414721 RepID=UPI001897606B|nr:phosphoenolpyruvate--protein phosphotransferase [Faecalispora jeddahensis]
MRKFKGIPAAAGLACATAVVARRTKSIPAGRRTLEAAVDDCVTQVHGLREKAIASVGGKNAEIFSVYEALLNDPYLLEPIRRYEEEGVATMAAVELALEERAALFEQASSEYMKQRADDIRSLKTMLLDALDGGGEEFCLPQDGGKAVIFAEELTPVQTMGLNDAQLAGLVIRHGGLTSHVVILAKALGIPAVVGFEALDEIVDGVQVLLDGETGEVVCEPNQAALDAFGRHWAEYEAFQSRVAALPKGSCVTLDGQTVRVSINIGSSTDLDGLEFHSLHGVGLYRTEFLFCERETEPSEAEQIEEYRRVFRAVGEHDLIVRTLDIGGDKTIPYLDLPKEENPFLGCRGIRLCLKQQTLLRRQIRALIKASEGRNFSVMFPMVDTLEEFRQAKETWNEVCRELQTEGTEVGGAIRLGIMIETPAAALCADLFVREVDFASIGTNDLIQYIMAADRGNSAVSALLTHYEPAVIRMMNYAIGVFCKAGVKISVCGEAGSDVKFLPLLLGMGLRDVSVSRSMADKVRYCAANTGCKSQRRIADRALGLATGSEVCSLLNV